MTPRDDNDHETVQLQLQLQLHATSDESYL